MSDQPTNHETELTYEIINPYIDIGEHQTWIDLYKEQFQRNQNLNNYSDSANQALKAMLDITSRLQLESSFAKDSNNTTGMIELTREVEATGEQLINAQNNAAGAYQAVSSIYGEVSFKEWELGCVLEKIDPAQYVTRAIGVPSQAINKRYRQVRAEIEVIRQLTNEQRTDITLGKHNEKPWIVNKLSDIVLNIQKLQIAQIVLSKDPEQTAIQFGKYRIISNLGLPPKITFEDVGELIENNVKYSWYDDALIMTRDIEPIENGLTIDRTEP